MKPSIHKKIWSLLLAVLLLLTSVLPAAAANVAKEKKNPVLIITGFSAYPLENPSGKVVFPVQKPDIMEAVKQAAPFLLELLKSPKAKADYDAFYNSAIHLVVDMFDPVACNPDGTIKHEDVKLSYQYPESAAYYGKDTTPYHNAFNNPLYVQLIEDVGAENVFVYGLDWRKDPFDIADEINDWVKHIKEVTGSEKVSISGISMGGVMVSAYIAKYGTDDISNINMISAAFTGVAYVGELFKGNMKFNQTDLLAMIDHVVGVEELSKILGSTGILKQVLGLLDTFLLYEQDNLYRDFVLPAFAYDLGFWSFVPNQDLREAKAYIFSHYTGTALEQIELEAKIDAYQLAQKNVKSTFARAQRNGVSVAVISNYNLPMPPVSPDSNYTGDKVIETVHTSGGATAAPLGKTLVEAPTPNKYRSVDGMIDASTCMFPESTWFIKNMEHVAFTRTENLADFYSYVLTAKKQVDIDDHPDFPQFMVYDPETQILVPATLQSGDVDRNGTVNLVDARKVLRHVKEIEKLDSIPKQAADFDGSNKVTLTDGKRIMKAYMGYHDPADDLFDKLVSSGVPEDKIPELKPVDISKLPPELQEIVQNPKLPTKEEIEALLAKLPKQ